VIAVAGEGQEAAENWKTIPYDGVRLRKALKMLGRDGTLLKVCYEAGNALRGVPGCAIGPAIQICGTARKAVAYSAVG